MNQLNDLSKSTNFNEYLLIWSTFNQFGMKFRDLDFIDPISSSTRYLHKVNRFTGGFRHISDSNHYIGQD